MFQKRFHFSVLFASILCVAAGTAHAGEADIVEAKVSRTGDGTYHFAVTVRHVDEGWEHYADRWDVLAPDGTLIASRVLAHPHVNEQPFTRSLSGVSIPETVREVVIRANDSVHGLGGEEVRIAVPH